MPPNFPNVAKFETGRNSRITLPTSVCPGWFKSGLEVFFMPLFWKDELQLPDTKRLEAMLVCSKQSVASTNDWYFNPISIMSDGENTSQKPEDETESIFLFATTITENKRQFKIYCPPMIKGLCDELGRLYVLEHSLGITIWSPPAFNEQFGK